jgi:L-2-hydroxyglutarate oxidase
MPEATHGMPRECDFLIIGGGVIGINIARELRRRNHGARVVVLEKESAVGEHASGRNSGVVHAGFYYSADSLKARFTRIGNRQLTEYCDEKGLPIHKCGKLVVAKDDDDQPLVDELLRRAQVNSIDLVEVDAQQAKDIEPRVRTRHRALFSPTTSSIDPLAVLQRMSQDAQQEGVQLCTGVRYLGRQGDEVVTSRGKIRAGTTVNAAGVHADRVARDFGFAQRLRILPFKGLYLESREEPGSLRTNVYPVPDLRNPFLGVHTTVAVDGHIKLGPTALPAFWREQYSGFENFRPAELWEILGRQLGLFLFSGFDFKRLAFEEIAKRSKARMVALASALVEGVRQEDYPKWGRPGIRAQLLDVDTRKLVMDFELQGDERSMHILNAVSPAFTCCLPFASYVCDQMEH